MSRITMAILGVLVVGVLVVAARPAAAAVALPSALTQPAPAAGRTPAAPAAPNPGAVIYEIPLITVPNFDPSIEGAGMGGASMAAFWQENPDDWANPALMGFHHGLRYGYGQTQLFADDVQYTTHRFLAGAWGVGVAMAGKPWDSVGHLRLSYGESNATDEFGNVVGPFDSHTDTHSIAVGVSLLDLASSLAVATGHEPIALSRRLSIAVGHSWKDFVVDLAPSGTASGALTGEGSNKDYGAIVRVTAMDHIGDGLYEPSDRSRSKLELSAAYSRLNYDEDGVVEYESGSTQPLPDLRQAGAAARLTVALPSSGTGWSRDWSTPAIALGVAWDQSDLHSGGLTFDYATHVGGELSLFDALYLRVGHVSEDFTSVSGTTYGVGLSIKHKGIVGVRGDWASYPGPGGIAPSDDRRDRYGITFFVDPFRVARGEL